MAIGMVSLRPAGAEFIRDEIMHFHRAYSALKIWEDQGGYICIRFHCEDGDFDAKLNSHGEVSRTVKRTEKW